MAALNRLVMTGGGYIIKANRSTFPRPNLGRMYAILLRQLRHHNFFTDRLKRNFGFEIRRRVLSSRNFESTFS